MVQLPTLVCGGREAVEMAPNPTCDSAVSPCFHGYLAFLHRHFPPQSPPSHPLSLSLRSQQQPSPWDCSTIPNLQLPADGISQVSQESSLEDSFQGIYMPVWGMYGGGKGCLILIPFRLPQISCFTLSLKCFSSDSDSCPAVGIRPLLRFPHLLRAGESYSHSCFSS